MAFSQALVTWYAALALSRISDQREPGKPFHFNNSFLGTCAAGGEFFTHKYNQFSVSGNFWRFNDGSALIIHYGADGNGPETYYLVQSTRFTRSGCTGGETTRSLDP